VEWNLKVTHTLRHLRYQKGTYCQERELEAINRQDYTQGNDNKFFPNALWKFPKILSFKDIFGFRWRSWEVVNTCKKIPRKFSNC
jgi:hypothetical protein